MIINIAGNSILGHPMFKLCEFIVVDEIRQQVTKNTNKGVYFKNIKVSDGIHSTWSKYPCNEDKNCEKRNCFGTVSFSMDIDTITEYLPRVIKLYALHRKKKTFIVRDVQFRNLAKNNIFVNYKIIKILIW